MTDAPVVNPPLARPAASFRYLSPAVSSKATSQPGPTTGLRERRSMQLPAGLIPIGAICARSSLRARAGGGAGPGAAPARMRRQSASAVGAGSTLTPAHHETSSPYRCSSL